VEETIAFLDLDKDKPHMWSEDDLSRLSTTLRKKTKPMLIACNKIDVPGASENLAGLKQLFSEYTFIGCSAEAELALKEAAKADLIDHIPGENTFSIPEGSALNERQRQALAFIESGVLKKFGSTGVQEVLDKAVFSLLGYLAIFPGGARLEDKDGNVLPDCFLMPKASTALDFAYKLHTDFGKNFIRAIDIKTKRTVGKEHLLRNLDIIEIVAGR